MPANAFIGKTAQPTDAELSVALGPARTTWDQLLSGLAQMYGVNVHEWKCHSPKWGWTLRVKRKDRTIVWLSPSEDCFNVLFILGDKAMLAARKTPLPRRIVHALEIAPKYPDGTGVRLVVRSPRDVGTLKKLAAIKLAN
ncbi:MAG: DUF3788 domain-containing protein [Opitutaceae bacterium]|nr:DUF3788 domain-containing protein [Opitutaceae bacterium]